MNAAQHVGSLNVLELVPQTPFCRVNLKAGNDASPTRHVEKQRTVTL